MPAKNNKKRPPRGIDLHHSVAAHVEAHRLAYGWAAKCLVLREAGKTSQAKAAEDKARYYLAKAMVIEGKAAHGKPTGGQGARD
jgi:hypothetical protein